MGNLEHVRYLVDVWRCPINEADAHDATPLYLAALTGHTEICQWLLERGAKCNHADDAARIFYVALTPSLRRMLQEWSLSAAARDPYLDSLKLNFSSATTSTTGTTTYPDCAVRCVVRKQDALLQHVDDDDKVYSIFLHSIMVRFRCPWLARRIQTTCPNEEEKSDLPPHSIDLNAETVEQAEIVLLLLEYLYTGCLELHSNGDLETAFLAMTMAASWELESLHKELKESIDDHLLKSERQKKSTRTTSIRFRCEISIIAELRNDMKRLANAVSTPHCEITSLEALTEQVQGSDVTLHIGSSCNSRRHHPGRSSSSSWSVHRFRLCTQSDYFAGALRGEFREAGTSTLDLSAWVEDEEENGAAALQCIIQWIYADCFLEPTTLSIEVAVEILNWSTALLVNPRLSAYVATSVLIPAVSVDSVFFLLNLARTTTATTLGGCGGGGFERLEDACCHCIARDILGSSSDTEEDNKNNNEWTNSFAPALRTLLATEALEIVQAGDVAVADVPLAADIRRAIFRLYNNKNDRKAVRRRDLKLAQLSELVQQAIKAV